MSGGNEAITSRAWRRAATPWSRPQNRKPKCTIGPASCRANSNSVTIAKSPPPPRNAQNRSVFSSSDATRTSPAAVTTRAESRLSIASPYLRLSHPMPPPSVRPPTPVWLISPTGTARPCAWVAASRSPSKAPPPTLTRRVSGSTTTSFMAPRSITRPSSTTDVPAMLCAPPRTATSRPLAAAYRTAVCTSDSSAHRATASGRRSTAAFQTRRLSSYVGSSAPMTSPRSRLRRSLIGALAVWVMGCLPLVRGGRKNTSPVTAAGTGVNKPPLTGVPRTVRYFLAALVVAAPFSVAIASGAQAQDVTCQGQAATVVGTTDGFNTVGTEGDDVIVAPLGNQGRVLGLGGNDTICLVDGASGPSRDPIVSVDAGAGNDTVHNLRSDGTGSVDSVRVRTPTWATTSRSACSDHVLAPRGGHRRRRLPDRWRGRRDHVRGGWGREPRQHLDGRRQRQHLVQRCRGRGPPRQRSDRRLPVPGRAMGGRAVVDNVARRASIGGSTVLSWTSVDGFSMRAVPGSHVTFIGSDADEDLALYGSVRDLAAPAAVSTGGGDDSVHLENYLPSSVDLGEGTTPSPTWPATAPTSRWPSPQNAWAEAVSRSHGPRGDRVLPRPDGQRPHRRGE